MKMTEGEIRRVYRAARNKKKQISILADLNGCSTGKILEIVHSGREMPDKKTDFVEWDPPIEQKDLMNRLDELETTIKQLEDEYRKTAAELIKVSGEERM